MTLVDCAIEAFEEASLEGACVVVIVVVVIVVVVVSVVVAAVLDVGAE